MQPSPALGQPSEPRLSNHVYHKTSGRDDSKPNGTYKQLLEHLDRAPFQPFRIVTTSGDGYEVLTPHQVAIAVASAF